MKISQAKRLKKDDRVVMKNVFLPDGGIEGIVTECDDKALYIEWGSDERTVYQFDDMETQWYLSDVKKLG